MMGQGIFVSGTDTGIGKSRVACALLKALAGLGLRVAGYKPVAAGAEWHNGRLCNEDALQLQAASTQAVSYGDVNPVCLPLPASPHIAAGHEQLQIAPLIAAGHALQGRADVVVGEGAGGWLVPLNAQETVATLAQGLQWPVILVVGMRLGCINHACLTLRAMLADGVQVAGWVANHLDDQLLAAEEVRQSLLDRLPAPLLADMAWQGEHLQWTEDGQRWLKKYCK